MKISDKRIQTEFKILGVQYKCGLGSQLNAII